LATHQDADSLLSMHGTVDEPAAQTLDRIVYEGTKHILHGRLAHGAHGWLHAVHIKRNHTGPVPPAFAADQEVAEMKRQIAALQEKVDWLAERFREPQREKPTP
jgi:hypothetical protein